MSSDAGQPTRERVPRDPEDDDSVAAATTRRELAAARGGTSLTCAVLDGDWVTSHDALGRNR